MDLEDKDKVVSPFGFLPSRAQGSLASREQLVQRRRESAPHQTPKIEKPQKWDRKAPEAPRPGVRWQRWPPGAEGSPEEPLPSLLMSCEPEALWQPKVPSRALRATSANRKVAAQSPRKWEPGPRGKEPALLHLESSDDEDTLTDSWEDLEETLKTHSVTQAPRGAFSFLEPQSRDHRAVRDTWVRRGAEPGQPESLAVPCRLQRLRVLPHGAHILATAVNSFTRHVFTCGMGGLKVWYLDNQVARDGVPESHVQWPIQSPGAYLRACLLAPNGSRLFAGGHHLPGVSTWDLAVPSLHQPDLLPCEGLSCQALDTNLSGTLAFAGFSNGIVRIWDLRDPNVVKDLPGRQGEANSVVIKDDTVWTGGLNGCLCCWDLRASQKIQKHLFKSQITSLSQSPWDDWLLVGLASGLHWLQPTVRGQAHIAGHKDGAILGLKFSPYGQWWVSVGTDKLTTIHSMPRGATEFQVPEKSCITCCDVSANNRLIVTGARDHASVYQVTY